MFKWNLINNNWNNYSKRCWTWAMFWLRLLLTTLIWITSSSNQYRFHTVWKDNQNCLLSFICFYSKNILISIKAKQIRMAEVDNCLTLPISVISDCMLKSSSLSSLSILGYIIASFLLMSSSFCLAYHHNLPLSLVTWGRHNTLSIGQTHHFKK